MIQVGTGSSSDDLHAALLMRRCTAVSSMGSNPAMLEAHGGPLKTGGAADADASFSASDSENTEIRFKTCGAKMPSTQTCTFVLN